MNISGSSELITHLEDKVIHFSKLGIAENTGVDLEPCHKWERVLWQEKSGAHSCFANTMHLREQGEHITSRRTK